MGRFLALLWVVGCATSPEADDAGLDGSLDAPMLDATKDAKSDATSMDAGVDASGMDATTDADAGDDGATTDAGDDAAAVDAATDADMDASTDAGLYDAGLCGVCKGGTVCCTIPKAIDYGKCYSPKCLACCM